MRIGIPNILPLAGYTFFGAISVTMTIRFFDKIDTAKTGPAIFLALLILMSYGMFVLLSYRFKIVAMTDKTIFIIWPFRFQYKNFRIDKIVDLKWDLLQAFRLGDYRKLVLKTSSGFQANISDLEFINYDSLERWLISRTSLKLNLGRKLNIELRQAKWNKWLNIVVIMMFTFFFFVLSNGRLRTDIRLAIQIIMIVITWRLLVRLVQYQKRINGNT